MSTSSSSKNIASSTNTTNVESAEDLAKLDRLQKACRDCLLLLGGNENLSSDHTKTNIGNNDGVSFGLNLSGPSMHYTGKTDPMSQNELKELNEPCLKEFIKAASEVEQDFHQKYLRIATARPDLVERDEIEALKYEIARKEKIIPAASSKFKELAARLNLPEEETSTDVQNTRSDNVQKSPKKS